MSIDRRAFVRGGLAAGAIAATPLAWSVAAEPAPLLFAGSPLAQNPAARLFRRVDMALPDIAVETAAGRASLAGVGGKARMISLWAEWCVPCLVEIREFAALRPKVANDRFDIGLLMTASVAKLDHAGALARLRPLGAAAMPLLVEPGGGVKAAYALASGGMARLPGTSSGTSKGPSFSLPCTLLVDARGRVKGRTFGAPTSIQSGARPALTDAQRAAMKRGEPVVIRSRPLDQADKDRLMAEGRTIWASPAAQDFLAALGDGLLDRV